MAAMRRPRDNYRQAGAALLVAAALCTVSFWSFSAPPAISKGRREGAPFSSRRRPPVGRDGPRAGGARWGPLPSAASLATATGGAAPNGDRSASITVAAALAAVASANAQRSGFSVREWALRARPALLVLALVLQKCSTDALTWYTRSHGASYSGASVSLLSEVFKYPVLAMAIATMESPSAVIPTFWAAATQAPWVLAWAGAAYAAQNLLYFVCLDHITAAAYQVLSQSKLIFTAAFMRIMIGRRFTGRELAALALLVLGGVATQLSEASGGSFSLSQHGNALFGCAVTVLSAMLAALPNVFYERMLKKTEGQSEWAVNTQLTTWILFWVCMVKLFDPASEHLHVGAGVSGLVEWWAALTRGFTPTVWLITFLKTLTCVIVPTCLKYGDNILYGYAKPVSIVITCTVTGIVTSSLPPPLMFAGVGLVLSSMWLYGRG